MEKINTDQQSRSSQINNTGNSSLNTLSSDTTSSATAKASSPTRKSRSWLTRKLTTVYGLEKLPLKEQKLPSAKPQRRQNSCEDNKLRTRNSEQLTVKSKEKLQWPKKNSMLNSLRKLRPRKPRKMLNRLP